MSQNHRTAGQSGGKPRPVTVSFKVDQDLADFLNGLPNASEFIREAILAEMKMVCPLCQGKGEVFPGFYDHYAEQIQSLPQPSQSV